MPKLSYFLVVILVFSASCTGRENVEFEYPSWTTIGTAKLSVLWFDIYEAELSSADGLFNQDQNFKLTLTYLRDFEADELIDETFNQISEPIEKQQELSWRKSLKAMWPDVKESDQISFIKTNEGTSHFFFNQKFVGTIEDKAFGKHFADIWLAKDSAYPKLASKLKGESK